MLNTLKDTIAQKLCEVLPEDITGFKKDLEKEFQAILASAFASLNLVTREEFDIQTRVLQETRARVEALETLVQAKNRAKK